MSRLADPAIQQALANRLGLEQREVAAMVIADPITSVALYNVLMGRYACQRVLPGVRLCQVVGLQSGFRHRTDTAG